MSDTPIDDGRNEDVQALEPGSRRRRVQTPGGLLAPSRPGQTPDRSTVPGHGQLPVPPAGAKVRPLSQYGSAQEIIQVYTPGANGEWDKSDFEQFTASYEELRKANPADLPPDRPAVPATIIAEVDDTPELPEGETKAGEVKPGAPSR